MVSAIALVSGVSAVFVGSLLLRTWLRHSGASGTSHFRRIQILGHAAVGILGVVLVVVHLAAGRDPRWGWTAVVVLLTAGLLGATMFLPWWWRGRKGLYGTTTRPASTPPRTTSGCARCRRMAVSLT
jgi:hypothetical protein